MFKLKYGKQSHDNQMFSARLVGLPNFLKYLFRQNGTITLLSPQNILTWKPGMLLTKDLKLVEIFFLLWAGISQGKGFQTNPISSSPRQWNSGNRQVFYPASGFSLHDFLQSCINNYMYVKKNKSKTHQ